MPHASFAVLYLSFFPKPTCDQRTLVCHMLCGIDSTFHVILILVKSSKPRRRC